MKIGGFPIKKELFSTNYGLKVFEATHPDTGEPYIIRLADFSRNGMQGKQDLWYQLYDEYQLTITNFKHLPRVSSISQHDNQRLYSLLECEEGHTLRPKEKLGINEISQLIDAVSHLHRKKMVHGSINADNLWLTNQGRIILYGAGEVKVLENKNPKRFSTDIQQVARIIQDHSSLSKKVLDKLEMEDPTSMEELERILAQGETRRDPVRKGGLVERQKLQQKTVIAPTPVEKVHPRPSSQKEIREPKRSPNMERYRENNPSREERRNKVEGEHQERQNNQQEKREGSWFRKFVMSIVAVLALLFVIDQFTDPKQTNEEVLPAVVEEQKNTSGEKVVKEVVEQQKGTISETFSDKEVAGLLGEYLKASVDAINQRNFSLVEQLIDPNGKKYPEQRDYNKYLEEKNITEELLDYDVKDIVKVDETSFKVTTYEAYRIIYGDQSDKLKTFESGYIVKVLANGQLAVNELLFLEEITSQ